MSVTDGSVGSTLGVEEEYALVEAATGALADAPDVAATAADLVGEAATKEISTSQLEIVTPVCTSLAQVRQELVRLRSAAVAAAEAHGCQVLAAGTHPFATWHDQRLTDGERYDRLEERWGILARQQLITGQHVHVGVPAGLVVHVVDRLGPDLPVLIAMTASSPYWEGQDTGYASYRTQWFSRWPITGTLPPLGTRQAYDDMVARLVSSGVADDASHLYWDARPSVAWPTVEVRVADTSPLLDDAILHAALVRSLVRTAARDEDPVPVTHPEVVRVARWRAARDGLSGRLFDTRSASLQPAHDLVRALLARLREDLEELGDWDEVCLLTEQLLERGTSADRQRAVWERTGSLQAVVRSLTDEVAGQLRT